LGTNFLKESIAKPMTLLTIFFNLFFLSSTAPIPQSNNANAEFCGGKNVAFKDDESVLFHVYYSVIGIYVHAGSVTFAVNAEKYNNKPVYHVIGAGSSNPSYDWIFKVRDKYESYIDTASMQTLKFLRHVEEGKFKMDESASFDNINNTVTTEKGTQKVPNCIQDVLSAIYYARNIDYNKYEVDAKIPFNMYLDNQVYNLYIKYLGKEEIKTRYGKFKAIKFKPLLVKGTMFEGGEKMTVWVSDAQLQ
jgi:hypothetical protein